MSARNGTAQVSTFQYTNPAQVWTLGTLLPAVCLGIVVLRFYTRRIQKANIGSDDWLILGGVVVFIGIGVCFIVGASTHTMGYSTPPFPTNLTTEAEVLAYDAPGPLLVGKLEFAIQFLTVVCYGLVKLSILSFYRRIFVVSKLQAFHILTVVTAVVVFLWTITFIRIVIFACPSRVKTSWGTAAEQAQYCSVIGFTSLEGLAASDFILDVVLIILPLPMIWRLRISTVKKIAVSGIMLLGAAAIGASVARLVLYVQTQQAKIAHHALDYDQIITLDMYWSTIECGLALVAACLPTLSYLFKGLSVQSAKNSMRGILSLQKSQSGPKSTGSHQDSENPYLNLEGSHSTSSNAWVRTKLEESTGSKEEYPLEAWKTARQESTQDRPQPTMRNGIEAYPSIHE